MILDFVMLVMILFPLRNVQFQIV